MLQRSAICGRRLLQHLLVRRAEHGQRPTKTPAYAFAAATCPAIGARGKQIPVDVVSIRDDDIRCERHGSRQHAAAHTASVRNLMLISVG